MLARLMKYEIKATARWFLPLYATMLIIALINGFTLYSPFMVTEYTFTNPPADNSAAFPSGSFQLAVKGTVSSFLMAIYVMMFIGIFAVTLIIVIQRFYKSLLGSEGYLMFTLPVEAWQHVLNKLIVSMIWCFLSLMVVFGSLCILVPKEELAILASDLKSIADSLGTVAVVKIAIGSVLGFASSILQIYTAISLGQLFNKHKLLISFGMYIGISSVLQFVSSLIIVIFTGLTYRPGISAELQISRTLNPMLFIAVVSAAGFFILTSYLLKRKLNLE